MKSIKKNHPKDQNYDRNNNQGKKNIRNTVVQLAVCTRAKKGKKTSVPLFCYLKTERCKCSVVSSRASNSTTEKMGGMCQEVCSHECTIRMSSNSNFVGMSNLKIFSTKTTCYKLIQCYGTNSHIRTNEEASLLHVG